MTSSNKRLLTKIKNKKIVSENIVYLLYIKEDLNYSDAEYLYAVSLIMIKEYENTVKDNKENKMLIDFAYCIIAKTSFKYNNFSALYDFSVNFGYYPVSRKIITLNLLPELKLTHIIVESQLDDFSYDNKIMTYEQKEMYSKILKSSEDTVGFIAPTSYGKSEIIFNHIDKYQNLSHIGIIVPTKALIDQVYRDSKNKVSDRKIIIHDQNYEENVDQRTLAVVTQERALRLIDEGMIFDVLYIDEAHELLNFNLKYGLNNRSLVLSRLIRISRKLNNNLKELYLSPVVQNSENLQMDYKRKISEYKIHRDLKILEINYLNIDGKLIYYDRYLGLFIPSNKFFSYHDYLLTTRKKKNLHFLYKPMYIEKYSDMLYQTKREENLEDVPEDIKQLVDEIKTIVHPKFKMARYLEEGIVYLHGSIPSIIRNYILKYVRESSYISDFVANSVILAGMNLPIDTLYYVSGTSNSRDLYNLIGRVNRLSEIFSDSNNDLGKIFIPIHFLEIEQFPQYSNGSMSKKIEVLRGSFKDDVKNPILDSYHLDKKYEEKISKIKEAESNVITSFKNPNFQSRLMRAGAQQLMNYTEAGLTKLEVKLDDIEVINNDDFIIDRIKILFFDEFVDGDWNPQPNAKRLRNNETISYYKNFIFNMNRYTIKTRVENLVNYWKNQEDDYHIYVGTQFGEVRKPTTDYPQPTNNTYVKLNDHIKDDDYLYNLAIIKLQIDEDFVSYELSLFLNTMLEFNIISQNQFDKIIFGTSNIDDVRILRMGISRTLFRILQADEMIGNIIFDSYGNAKANSVLEQYISQQEGIIKFELEQFFC